MPKKEKESEVPVPRKILDFKAFKDSKDKLEDPDEHQIKLKPPVTEALKENETAIHANIDVVWGGDFLEDTKKEEEAAIIWKYTPPVKTVQIVKAEGSVDTYDSDVKIELSNGDIVEYKYKGSLVPNKKDEVDEFKINGKEAKMAIQTEFLGSTNSYIGDLLLAYQYYKEKTIF